MVWYSLRLVLLTLWNLLFLGIYTLQLLWRVKRLLWDPRTWITALAFYLTANVFLLFFQVGLDVLLLATTGKTFAEFLTGLGNPVTVHGISSAITVFLFVTFVVFPVGWMLRPGLRLRIFRKEVVEEVTRHGRGYLISRAKRALLVVILGLLLGVVMS